MDRRAFLTAVGTVTLAGWFPVPKWLGDPAGGLYVPPPDDLSTVVEWTPWQPLMTMAAESRVAMITALWAPLGSSAGRVQVFMAVQTRTQLDRVRHRGPTIRKTTTLAALRDGLLQHHDPGWFKGEDGWHRVGFLQWKRPSDNTALEAALMDPRRSVPTIACPV